MQHAWHILKKIPVHVAVFLIRCYQVVLSPHFPSTCRFEPTCSCYGVEAFQKHGFVKGFYLTLRRILRCRPGGAHGYDPVP